MVVHTSSEAPRLPEARAFERAAGTTSHPKQSATKVDHSLAVGTQLQKLADPNACDPKTAAAAATSAATSAAASMAAPSTAAAASSTTASSATTSSAAASVAAPSLSSSNPHAACSGHFLVEDKESRQADVRDFLLTEDYRCGVLRRDTAGRNRGGCAARQRQRSSDSQCRDSSPPTFCL
jgi:hypothetical protein